MQDEITHDERQQAADNESPVTAVTRILTRAGIIPNPVLVMALFDAVRDTAWPPHEVTISMLSRILQSLDPARAVDAWAARSAHEIASILSRHPEVRRVTDLVDDDHLWCMIEGTISGMLQRVCRGQDLRAADDWTSRQAPDPREATSPSGGIARQQTPDENSVGLDIETRTPGHRIDVLGQLALEANKTNQEMHKMRDARDAEAATANRAAPLYESVLRWASGVEAEAARDGTPLRDYLTRGPGADHALWLAVAAHRERYPASAGPAAVREHAASTQSPSLRP